MVLSSQGGALKKMLRPFKIGFGGVIGHGKQTISWVTINDVVSIIDHIIKDEDLHGPINIVSPNPISNYNFTQALGNILNRPTIFPFPAFWAKILLGEMAQELLLASTKATPNKLQQSGYTFINETLEDALENILNENETTY